MRFVMEVTLLHLPVASTGKRRRAPLPGRATECPDENHVEGGLGLPPIWVIAQS